MVFATLQLRHKKIDEKTYQVFVDEKNFFMVEKNEERWLCECEESIKTMLPCVHEVLVCCKSHFSFDLQINKRWKKEDDEYDAKVRNRMLAYKKKIKRTSLADFLA